MKNVATKIFYGYSLWYSLSWRTTETVQGVSQKIKTDDVFSKLGIRLAFTIAHHHSWRQERSWRINVVFLFIIILTEISNRILQNAMGKKHFSAWNHTTHTNHQWEMFFSFFFINLGYGMEINRQIDFG